MTAAPASIVAMSTSCPGQSTKDTCLISCRVDSQVLHFGLSSFLEPNDLKHSGEGHTGHLYSLAFAYPSLMVMFLNLSL